LAACFGIDKVNASHVEDAAKLKVLQAKYKEEPEVLQKKIAEFYMKNKVNPFGGCLPMLVQLPILFALFGTLPARRFRIRLYL